MITNLVANPANNYISSNHICWTFLFLFLYFLLCFFTQNFYLSQQREAWNRLWTCKCQQLYFDSFVLLNFLRLNGFPLVCLFLLSAAKQQKRGRMQLIFIGCKQREKLHYPQKKNRRLATMARVIKLNEKSFFCLC